MMFDHFSEKDLATLEQRAQQIALDKAQTEDSSTVSMLRCGVGGEWYAVPLEDLTAIYRGAVVVPVPGTPAFFKGIANIRGRIVPVLGLAELLDVVAKGAPKVELVVVTHNDQPVALQVDHVDNVMSYAAVDIEAVPEDIQTGETAACLSDGTLVLDMGALLSDPDLVIGA